jgi:Fe-S cluster biogenesis protein NfuA
MEMTMDGHPLWDRVERALNNIRPFLVNDHGDVKLLGISDDHVVSVALQGACVTCPMSTMTMTAGVEQAVKDAVPEIVAVVSVVE